MTTEHVREYLKQFGRDQEVLELELSSATVSLAAEALNVEPGRIAKTMSFYDADKTKCILVVAAGDKKIDNAKFRAEFNIKSKMLQSKDVEKLTGYAPGGVCPFANPESARVFLDVSLKRFETVYPACGTDNSAIKLTCDDLEKLSKSVKWIDITKD
ncbi:YbaK [Tritrichomonas foetus]|uniref:YbaK n=1 Tax=Tritrichomonas foetus TaxID=1144522 RepID=A0A1J4KKH4_9EUKA|nr:YbaK [Tritrichomonas foetus]|eukprot:OHT09861.1 YbaK [Tritrichomonas foetus]